MVMRAATYNKYGGPEVIQISTIEKPQPSSQEVLIRVHYTSVNRTDCGFLRAKPFISRFFSGLVKPKNAILGNEFSGIVEAVGNQVTQFKKGDRVFGMNGITFGMHAEYICLPEDHAVAHIPDHVDLKTAGGICEGSFYAQVYFDAIPYIPGQSIFIYGATGAIGIAALQLAAHYGLKVSAVANTQNIELIKSMGATKVVDYLKQDYKKAFDERFDYIFDAVGKITFSESKHLLKPGGRYFATELGPYFQNAWFSIWCRLFRSIPFNQKKKVLFPLPIDAKARTRVQHFAALMDAKKLNSHIDRVYPLNEIKEAYRYVEKGEKTGSVIIAML